MARTTLYLGLLAALAPWLYDRYLALSTIVANRPGQFQELNRFKSYEIKFRDRVRNCEDVLLESELGLAFLSCDPGRDKWNTVMGSFKPDDDVEVGSLWIYDYSTPDLLDDKALRRLSFVDYINSADFHPLGIEFDTSTSTLYAVNHAQSGSVIDAFKVNLKDATATHTHRIAHPLIHTPNSIAIVGNGKLLVTNDHYVRAAISPLLSKIETFSGIQGGSVVYHDINDVSTTRVVARAGFANGIALLNATTVAVASSSKAGLYFYDIKDNGDLVAKGLVRTPVAVDNISVDGKGSILLSGHPFAPALMKVAQGRWQCKFDGNEAQRKACECNSASWVGEWNEKTGLKELYKGYEFCSSSTATRDVKRGVGMVSGLYERGILVFKD